MRSRRLFLLTIIGLLSDLGNEIVESRTKLMKIVYLVRKEKGRIVERIVGVPEPYTFEWYLFGPFSKEVLDDLELLEEESFINIIPVEKELYIQYNFKLTDKGKKKLEIFLSKLNREDVKELKDYVKKFKNMNLRQIKQYVYRKY